MDCLACNGSGLDDSGLEDCPWCNGTGEWDEVEIDSPQLETSQEFVEEVKEVMPI